MAPGTQVRERRQASSSTSQACVVPMARRKALAAGVEARWRRKKREKSWRMGAAGRWKPRSGGTLPRGRAKPETGFQHKAGAKTNDISVLFGRRRGLVRAPWHEVRQCPRAAWRTAGRALGRIPVFVHTSSDLRHLAQRLADIVAAPGLGPLEREVVLIQSAGMQRWLSRELAERLGIAANVEFPFPRAFLKRTLGQLLGGELDAERYERTALRWEIHALLAEVPALESYDLVRKYLAGEAPTLARLVLSEQLAHLYDQYLTYRPRLILGWEAGQSSGDFQDDLWRRLRERLGAHHLADRVHRLMNDVTDEQIRAVLPARVSLVGGPGLPPLYLQVLGRLGQAIDVHVLSLMPTGEYIADLHPHDDPLPELGRGAHPLLVSMGRLAADFQTLLQDQLHTEASAEFPLPGETTLLSALQRDIVEAARRSDAKRLPASFASDGTITLDSCHSRLREVEVLRDRLLGWFHEDPSLRPEDVVVLSPDIEAYSPLITAVFSARAQGGVKIPFRIADRSEGAENAAARALLLALHLLGGRLKASEMLDLLQCEPVAARFGLSTVDLERIGDWVQQASIRFGADPEHLAELGLGLAVGEETQGLGRHTWRVGLDRLLLGYALEDDGQSLFEGLVPVDDLPAGEADLLGRFAEFVEGVLGFRQRVLGKGLTPRAWQEVLRDFVHALLADGEGAQWDVDAALWTALDVCEGAALAVPDETFDLATLVHLLEEALSERRASSDFLSYGVTFCALLPLRTIPFRHVCVLGLDQATFPRHDVPHQLDLIARGRRAPGDRSLRDEDRQLFLEWIIGARERLALSYVGRSIQDDTLCPVSVVVTELTNVLTNMVEEGAPSPLAPTQHPLQPFSPRYFAGDPRLQSFDAQSFAGARALGAVEAGIVRSLPPFYVGPVPPFWQSGGSVPQPLAIDLPELVRFWKDPARGFLTRLRVGIDDEIRQFEDRETIGLDGLGRYQVGDDLLQRMVRGLPIVREVEVGRGTLPLGAAGEAELALVAGLVERLRAEAKLRAPTEEATLVDLCIDIELGDETVLANGGIGDVRSATLTGRLALRAGVLLEVGFQRISARAQLGVWIRHLALCAASLGDRTVLLARPAAAYGRRKGEEGPATFELGPVEPDVARSELTRLVRGFLEGQVSPICFSPEASLAYAGKFDLAQAMKQLEKEPGQFFEVFRDEDPAIGLSSNRAQEFQERSRDVFAPMLAHLEGVRG